MPERTLELGDPYHCHCQQDRAAARRGAGPRADRHLPVALRPRQMARARDRRDARARCRARAPSSVAIVAPGFAADCLETLEELAIRGREQFLARGRHAFRLSALPQRQRRSAWQCCEHCSRANLQAGVDARPRLAATSDTQEESELWHAWRSLPAEPAASARRSASRCKDMGMTVAANYAGNDERASAFTDRTGITAYQMGRRRL